MANCNRAGFFRAISLLLAIILLSGCAGGGQTLVETGGQSLPQEVTTEYLLTTAGFTRLETSDDTPKRQALLNNLPPGKISTYQRNGEVYHVYVDLGSKTLYLGDELAYQRYQTLAQGKKFCQRVPGANPVQFWGCMQEYQERGSGK